MQTTAANYNHHVIYRAGVKVPTPPSSLAEKRFLYLCWSLEKAQFQEENKEKGKIKAGYNDRMKKAGKYRRQKFGTLEHRNVFSDIYKVSRDLLPSFVVPSRPQ